MRRTVSSELACTFRLALDKLASKGVYYTVFLPDPTVVIGFFIRHAAPYTTTIWNIIVVVDPFLWIILTSNLK